MTFSYTDEKLTLECSPEEQAELRELSAAYTEEGRNHWTDQDESEFLERLIGNSALNWINPADTGDLTDAPMLGIWGPDIPESRKGEYPQAFGFTQCGCWDGKLQYMPILNRWAFEPYQVRSFLTDLMETGKTEFLSSW